MSLLEDSQWSLTYYCAFNKIIIPPTFELFLGGNQQVEKMQLCSVLKVMFLQSSPNLFILLKNMDFFNHLHCFFLIIHDSCLIEGHKTMYKRYP